GGRFFVRTVSEGSSPHPRPTASQPGENRRLFGLIPLSNRLALTFQPARNRRSRVSSRVASCVASPLRSGAGLRMPNGPRLGSGLLTVDLEVGASRKLLRCGLRGQVRPGRLAQAGLTWLRQEMAAWANRLESGSPENQTAARRELEQRHRGPDPAGVRD